MTTFTLEIGWRVMFILLAALLAWAMINAWKGDQ